MKMSLKELIQKAKNSSIPMIENIEQLPMNGFSYTLELIDEIGVVMNNKNETLLEFLLLIASRDGLNSSYTGILCKLLKEDWHYSHEDLMMMLEEIKDPASIHTIYETAINIPEYDDGRGLARKCIWALGAINTLEAREKLTLLANMEDPVISEVATLELGHNSNLS